MKRGNKLILLLAVFVLLAGTALLLPNVFTEADTSLEASEDTGTSILTLDSEKISAISWTYENETMMFDYTDGNWLYSADEDFPTDSLYLETMITDLSDLIITKTITDPGELADYGLDEPICSISVTEESVTEILIGNANAIGDSRYISIGDGNVYLADTSLLSDFSYTLSDLIKYEEIPDMYTVTKVSVTTADRDYQILSEVNDDTSIWYHEENNNKIALDEDLTDTFIDTIRDLSWNSCADYHADESILEEYGFSDPALVVTLTYETTTQTDTGETDEDGNTVYDTVTVSDTFSLEIGNSIDGYRYARISGSSMIYQIDENVYTTLADTYAEDLQAEAAEE